MPSRTNNQLIYSQGDVKQGELVEKMKLSFIDSYLL
jgi:hypothetical protein